MTLRNSLALGALLVVVLLAGCGNKSEPAPGASVPGQLAVPPAAQEQARAAQQADSASRAAHATAPQKP